MAEEESGVVCEHWCAGGRWYSARTGYDLFCGLAARSITRKGKCYSVGVRTIDVCVPASLPCPQEGGTSPLG